MKYMDFKTLSKEEMVDIKGGNAPIGAATIVGSNFSNGVCRIDIRICNASGFCHDFCNIASAPEATTAAACSAMVLS